VHCRGGCVVLELTGKSGVKHAADVDDGEICAVLRDLRRRRRGEDRLFAYWDPAGRRWRDVRAAEINQYLREVSGEYMTAKDFRTWHGTVKAAEALAEAGPQPAKTGRRRAVASAMNGVAEMLGNTPAVARVSYVDPRVVEAYVDGATAGTEGEVRKLLERA
jgi:DNA topoisomerase-1